MAATDPAPLVADVARHWDNGGGGRDFPDAGVADVDAARCEPCQNAVAAAGGVVGDDA